MKIATVLLFAALALASTTDLVEAKKSKTKTIAMNGDIIPDWNDLVSASKRKTTKKITLKRVQNRWNKLENKDINTFTSMYSSKDDVIEAREKVKKFYNKAETCLKKHKLKTKRTKTKFKQIMGEVRKCLNDATDPPKFEVEEKASLPKDYSDPVPVDDDDDDNDAEDDPTDVDDDDVVDTAAPSPTMMPTEAPTEQPNEGYSPQEITEPDQPMDGDVTYPPGFFDNHDVAPTDSPAVEVTETPLEEPTEPPQEFPGEVTMAPTKIDDPTDMPTEAPVEDATSAPTEAPFEQPTEAPFEQPTEAPFEQPTEAPFEQPTEAPFEQPTEAPFEQPTEAPFEQPTESPFEQPTEAPFEQPTEAPFEQPTEAPFEQPTESPFEQSTEAPFEQPTEAPFEQPTEAPFEQPTEAPFEQPTESPFEQPTEGPMPRDFTYPPGFFDNHDTTEAPVEEPTEMPTHAPYEEPTREPGYDIVGDITFPPGFFDSLTEAPADVPTESPWIEIKEDVPSYVYNPAIRQVAPFYALDVDGSSSISPEEWAEYVARVRDVALARAEKTSDPVAKELLSYIVEFHYSILNKCIKDKLETSGMPVFAKDESFGKFAKWVEDDCYVKFRYSLLSGPPPFEWIAKQARAITAPEIEAWLTKRVSIAKHDLLTKKIMFLSAEEHKQLEHIVSCAYKVLASAGETPVDRDMFYNALSHIEACVGSYPTL